MCSQEDIGAKRVVNPKSKEVTYNPTYEELFAPQVQQTYQTVQNCCYETSVPANEFSILYPKISYCAVFLQAHPITFCGRFVKFVFVSLDSHTSFKCRFTLAFNLLTTHIGQFT